MNSPVPVGPVPVWKKILISFLITTAVTLILNWIQPFLPFEVDPAIVSAFISSLSDHVAINVNF